MAQIYNKVALIGLGLIASSMSHAMRRGKIAKQIIGYSRSFETRNKAKSIRI